MENAIVQPNLDDEDTEALEQMLYMCHPNARKPIGLPGEEESSIYNENTEKANETD